MKRISLIGFEGTGFRNPRYQGEPGLIRAGHVGIAFEGEDRQIYGFHPSPEAILREGGEAEVLRLLINAGSIEGTVRADRAIFERAAELSEIGARTEVWQIEVDVSDEEFERIRAQMLEWYNAQKSFQYAFPRRDVPLTDDKDNCATFPRRLGLPLAESTGRLSWYIEAMMSKGNQWKPT